MKSMSGTPGIGKSYSLKYYVN